MAPRRVPTPWKTDDRMPKLSFIVSIALIAAVAVGCFESGTGAPSERVIYVSIPPQAGVVRAVAGERYDVRVLLPPGASHEAYEPRPSQLRELAVADLYVRIGVPFENVTWDRVRDINPKMAVVHAHEGIPLRPYDPHEGHAHGGDDPHVWLAPANMKHMAEKVAEALAQQDPAHADEYRANLAGVVRELDALDRDLRRELEPVRCQAFWVYHPAWGYFADAYGLEQRAVEQEGRELGAQSLARIVNEARNEGVRVIFVDPRAGAKSARLVAEEIGARVETLDPLAEDYAANLRAAARAIREGLE